MESVVMKDSSQSVKVAVIVRPLIDSEVLAGCTDCIDMVPGEPKVQIGSNAFTFDHVYGSMASSSGSIFDDCVAPLVEALFHGYNATVIAYGQIGSGKTYVMGMGTSKENNGGIIPNVMETIFSRVEEMKDMTKFLIRVSFVEIFNEEIIDLLDKNPLIISKGGVASKKAVPKRVPIQIRETVNGGITLAGVTQREVRTKQEMASFLSNGSIVRATESTNMNSQSSRSHAIFTISMEQKKNARGLGTAATNDNVGDDILSAKLHLVDLAGSDRASQTGGEKSRFTEAIQINKGLLSLGRVISALGDEKKRKEGGHVPYRLSKLTRFLQDSLGGNSKTVMIACVSPASSNSAESLNTLKYANQARNIQNKPIIDHGEGGTPSEELQILKQKISLLEASNAELYRELQESKRNCEQLQKCALNAQINHGEGGTPSEELQILKQKISLLEASNAELYRELQESKRNCEQLQKCALNAQVEREKLIMDFKSARKGKSRVEIDSSELNQDCDLMQTYVSKIQTLEAEVMRLQRLQSFNESNRGVFSDCLDLEDDTLHSRNAHLPSLHEFPSDCDSKATEAFGRKIHANAEASDSDELFDPPKIVEKLGAVPHGLSTDSDVVKREAESMSRRSLRSGASKEVDVEVPEDESSEEETCEVGEVEKELERFSPQDKFGRELDKRLELEENDIEPEDDEDVLDYSPAAKRRRYYDPDYAPSVKPRRRRGRRGRRGRKK